MSSRKWNNLRFALKYWRPKLYSKEPHVKLWPFKLKFFSQLLDKIKWFCKKKKIIKIKFRSTWGILKALTASRNLDIYKNTVLYRKTPLEGAASNLWIQFIWLLFVFYSSFQRIWNSFWVIIRFSLLYALTSWHPNTNPWP